MKAGRGECLSKAESSKRGCLLLIFLEKKEKKEREGVMAVKFMVGESFGFGNLLFWKDVECERS